MGLRKEAKLRGEKWYYTGKPCKRGHIVERRVVTGMCKECGHIYAEQWRRKQGVKKRKSAASEEVIREKHRLAAKERRAKAKANGVAIKPEPKIVREETFAEMAARIYKRDQKW